MDGYQVFIDVLYMGCTESHQFATVSNIRRSPLSRLLGKIVNAKTHSHYLQIRFPTLFFVVKRLRSVKPKVLVLRSPNLYAMLLYGFVGRLMGVRILIYTQGAPRLRSVLGVLGRTFLLRVLSASGFTTSPYNFVGNFQQADFAFIPFAAKSPVKMFPREIVISNPKRLLMIGKFEPRKNHHFLLSSLLHKIKQEHYSLTIVGECSSVLHFETKETLVELVNFHQVNHLVTIITNVPFDQMEKYYLSHDLFILPSDNEPASVSILEAMSHGLPTVATFNFGTSQYIMFAKCGYVFNSGDPLSLEKAVERCFESEGAYRQLSANAINACTSVFSQDAYVKRLKDLINGVNRREVKKNDFGCREECS
jgi:glycosyltransferase involved in cell wall biosynthesis